MWVRGRKGGLKGFHDHVKHKEGRFTTLRPTLNTSCPPPLP